MRRFSGGQWTVIGLLLAAIGLEFIFSPYWHPWIQQNLVSGAGSDRKVYISNQGFLVMAFLLFTIILLVMLASVSAQAAIAVSALILLSVTLARAQPIIDWMDATTNALKGASGA